MYCIKCGKENAADAMYCQKCGALIEADEETRVAGREYRAPTLRAPTTPSAKAAATALVQE
ncbi:MAG: zinc ribbon domain-containing protein, partial [Acidobacteria bacterium]|nr:zinc ribbon domain-containing protein [Acidobacteriota bacterium]